MKRSRHLFGACTCVLIAALGAQAQIVLDAGLIIEPLVQQSRQFTGLTFLGPNRFLLTERATGNVRLFDQGVLLEAPVLTLPVPAPVGSHDGLLGVIKDPQFESNHYVYFYYTRADAAGNPLADRLSRFTWTGLAFDPDSEFVLRELPGLPEYHHGGSMVFGPDEKLYLVTGDRGRSEQTTNHPSGGPNEVAVILRLNRDGTVPSDNPFVHQPGWEYIFGYGVRNSFGLAIDPVSCYVWNTENGTGAGFEELNLYPPGGNGGWNRVIGITDPNPPQLFMIPGATYVNPKLQYHGVPTALVFQPCPVLGAANWNRMFLGFFVAPAGSNDNVWRLTLNAERDAPVVQSPDLQDSVVGLSDNVSEFGFVRTLPWIVDMEIGPDGFLYILRFASPSVYRIRPNHPTCDADVDGDLDLSDFAVMQGCYSGSSPLPQPGSACRNIADVNGDGWVDHADLIGFSGLFSGPLPPR